MNNSHYLHRILICTGIYPPDIGGPATYSQLLKDELPKRGFEVRILSFGEVRKFPKIIRHIIYFFKVLKKAFSADIIYAQDPVSVGLPSVLAAKILNKKFLLKVVGDYAWEQYCQQNKSLLELPNLEEFQIKKYDFITELRRKIERWVAKKADKIIVPSEYLKSIVKKWDISDSRIAVIYNSLEEKSIEPKVKKENIIFSAGRLVPWKGFELLIEIMKELPKDFKLFIAGSGPMEADLKLKIKDFPPKADQFLAEKLENRVFLLGNLSQDQMRHYFGLAKVFVLNTAYEGLSHIILEAMQNGVPVITTNVGGNPELIKNKFNGLLVEYNNKNQLKDAILNVIKNDDLRAKFIENSHKELMRFSLETMLKNLSSIFRSLNN
jgi:glycosyltransferase involved in cell wall biosynthesis